ncbi:hypothetical protein, partial [Pseudomonas sp. YL2]|uniref:hypothetical protein n=1 Tax=Pseudomonas sp. YL2 TaxID=2904251 RepID=UPI001FF25D8C
VRSGDIHVECAGLFVSKPTPTGLSAAHKIQAHRKNSVGAGLLAKTSGQAISMSNVPASS